ncbi:cyclohexanecarboxylate-CoA ligase [Streptomyces sp. BK022]|uniref:AMP-binding protein n=1 Tax=Streptomyces sp. BK022 TaxID=2512123 RepID=UPI00102A04C5|nr:AMP-binding protein [Streptomyces sp. BK022]RZU45740.1 cyclohexanecarboxylate-CoA ligase [Streptomyces sp. BK022]
MNPDTDCRSLVDVVWERARRDAGGRAVVELGDDVDVTLTWAELVDRADRAAAVLLELGVRPGENVVVQLPNSINFVVMALATLRIGAVCCPVLPVLGQRELGHALARSRARVLVVASMFRGRDQAAEAMDMVDSGLAPHLRHLLVSCDPEPAPAHGGTRPDVSAVTRRNLQTAMEHAPVELSAGSVATNAADDIAHLMFTSGTTEEPKGVPHRMGTLDRAVALMSRRIGLTEKDVVHIASPMAHHSGFLYGMWLSLSLGCVQVIQPVWNADRALRAFALWQGTFMQGTAPFLVDMVDAVDRGVPVPRSLRTFVITGSAVPRALATRARELLGTHICAAWGSTETCMATLAAPADDPQTVEDGYPLDGVRIRVVDENGDDLGRGREGHLEVTGPFVFTGYLDRDDLSREAFSADGWYRSGDLAVIKQTGHVRITGRAKDIVNRGGEKIPVNDIEQLILAHPAVADAAIVAMPDPRLGERACLFAVVVEDGTVDLKDIQIHLEKNRVTRNFWPEHIEIVDVLPRNLAGKVQKYLLREIAQKI